jgi:hypothetical protein
MEKVKFGGVGFSNGQFGGQFSKKKLNFKIWRTILNLGGQFWNFGGQFLNFTDNFRIWRTIVREQLNILKNQA